MTLEKAMKNEVLPVSELWSLLDRAEFAIGRLRELELAQFNLTKEKAAILHILRKMVPP